MLENRYSIGAKAWSATKPIIEVNRSELGRSMHLDEVFLKINGRFHYLWRAVDQVGEVLKHPRSEPKGERGGKEVLSQIIKEIAVCTACAHYRQAEEL
jgi:transposase-like protein